MSATSQRTLQKTERSRLTRRNPKGHYDAETIYSVLDSGLIAHIGYVHEGHPIVTPTAYWREDNRLYWHGAASGRFIKSMADGPVCVTVTHFDGLIFARSGFHHSALFRTVMAFGHCTLINEAERKEKALATFLNRLLPGRAAVVRPNTKQELKATTLVEFAIDEASAKIRDGGVQDAKEDYDFPVWAGLLKTKLVVEDVVEDERLCDGTERPAPLADLALGTALEDYVRSNIQLLDQE
ncbi:MAG: pyridoxamine 5'-phosphate oxidase family protein [Rhodospirillaceae bacterium]